MKMTRRKFIKLTGVATIIAMTPSALLAKPNKLELDKPIIWGREPYYLIQNQ